MRRLLIVLAVASSMFVITAEDALSRGGRGGRGGGGVGGGRGGSRGGSRGGRTGLGRSAGRRNNSNNNKKSAKELEQLQLAAARLAEIEERRKALNADSRRKVQQAYAFALRLEAGSSLGADLGSR